MTLLTLPNPLIRWAKFNLVGLLGMAVQLATLALLNRLFHRHYLLATAAALELTLLHNFAWHLHYTWRDRRGSTPWPQQLLRFHLSNGLVSLAGNLLLMRLLVYRAHLPVLAANAAAIACCSLANFLLSHRWAFAATAVQRRRPTMRRATLLVPPVLLFCSSSADLSAQTVPARDYGVDAAYENVFVGPALSAPGSANQPAVSAGVTLGQYFARPFGEGLRGSPQFEFGITGPLDRGHALDGLVSLDAMFAGKFRDRNLYPSFTVGYTRFFVTGNAVNFGVAFDVGKASSDMLGRLELRDYFLFTGPGQHVIELRFGFGKLIAD